MSEKEDKNVDVKVEIKDMKTLMEETIRAEATYKEKKLKNEMDYSKNLIITDWDKLNAERKEQGLPKLGNQDMKKAYIQEELMYVDYMQEQEYESVYNKYRRMFDVAMKYSYDILR